MPPCSLRPSLRNVYRQAHGQPKIRRGYASKLSDSIFSDSGSAEFIAAAGSPSSLPKIVNHPPEIIVTGRANVGKSTLLNAVLGRTNLLHTSKRAGRTQTLNFYRVGPAPGRLVLVDAPGYGYRGRPEWGELFDHYVATRRDLRRIYFLINAEHGLKENDQMMLEQLNQKCTDSGDRLLTMQAVLTKADTLRNGSASTIQRLQKEIFDIAPLCLPAIVTASSNGIRFGIDEVRQSIAEACGLGRVTGKVLHG